MKEQGYSGTPLAKKLGMKPGAVVFVLNSPKPYLEFFLDFPEKIQFATLDGPQTQVDFIHIFATKASELELHIQQALPLLKKDGMLWLSWPKKSSGIATELDKHAIRQFGLDGGLVDTKVAAIDADWSGHKFMYRTKDRR